ncbi:MAG: hypothetical protein CMH48_10970 [Muricauda sp.]|nr:hypothetical protein [Allomuricauda sp.]MBC31353.1 hypothetical protein [Allomuricauda sp.]|tara:strand:+ start:18651 stop:19292 length:642 start_codon:yes stop_codon:yes gene_type:complete
MMDELELLKKDWQQKEGQLPRLSYDEIYKMVRRKSSSVVKWIFYISIAEFLFWIILFFVPVPGGKLMAEGAIILQNIEVGLEIIRYAAVAYFIVKFYQNFKKISVTDSAKNLMKNIIVVRRTVMQYVWFNLGVFAVMMVIVFIEYVNYDPRIELKTMIAEAENSILLWLGVCIALLVSIGFFAFLLWLFYRILYGILLKRLNENYRELKKLEI